MKTQFIFFSGKGGVGKTSMACATAVRNADQGHKTLLVATDPASNLADIFEQPIGHRVTKLKGVAGLWAMEIESDAATREYKDRLLHPLRGAFAPENVRAIEERLNSPCAAEVAAFDQFTGLLGQRGFERIIFDTAPTGHTLRLLQLPAEWARSIEDAASSGGRTCLGPADALQSSKKKYEQALAVMRDSSRTTFIFVLQPEATPLKETLRATMELGKLAIYSHQIIVNAILPPEEAANEFFANRVAMQKRYLYLIEQSLHLPTRHMFLLDREIKGIDGLRAAAVMLFDVKTRPQISPRRVTPGRSKPICSAEEVVNRLEPKDQRRVVFFAGKGGVGKTSMSCVTAVWLAGRGHRTLLLTTDPAAHLGNTLEAAIGSHVSAVPGVPNLWAANINAKAAAEDYKKRVLEDSRRRGCPPEVIVEMEGEMDSPCTEEMAAFDKFIEFSTQTEWDNIVVDTAPTGHTLKLLKLHVDWSKQPDMRIFATVDAAASDDAAKKRFANVIDMMCDPKRSTLVLVMYPESTAIVEAHRAAQEVRSVGMTPGLVVANLILPTERCETPYARAREAMQAKYLSEIAERFTVPVLQVPMLDHEVKGLDVLRSLGERIYGKIDGESKAAGE